VTREADPDSFLVDDEGRLLCYSSKSGVDLFLRRRGLKTDWTQEAELDFDEFWMAIKGLRVNRASSTKTCARLLNGWNFLEDLLRALAEPDWLKRLSTASMKRIYDKLYYGNNLPAVTPVGRSYSPLWPREEIVLLRGTFRKLWHELAQSNRLPS
jgi:hypothetical protein